MNADTQRFEAVESYQPTEPQNAPRSRALTVVIVVAVLLLTAAAVLIVGQLLYGSGTATVEASPAPVATSPEPAEQEPADETPQVTDPDPEPADAPAAPPVDDGHEGPSSDPVEPPASEPTTYTHPLAGTLWDVVGTSDGMGNNYDIHPAFSHQFEFDDSHVYSRGFVNSGSATYAITGNEFGWGESFSTGPLMTTLMLGPADAMMQEGWINSALGNAASYEIDEYTLFIRDATDTTTLILEIVPGC